MKAYYYYSLCLVLLMFLVSHCTEHIEPEPLIDTPITDTTEIKSNYKLVFSDLDTIPSFRKDTLFGIDMIRIHAELKNLRESETIDYSQVDIKQTEGKGGTMLITNNGSYLEIKLSIDKITTKTVAFGYDVYYKGKKTQHLSHDLFQSWIGYTLQVMHAEYYENGSWKTNLKSIINPTEQYRTYYLAGEKYALYKGSTKVDPLIFYHNQPLDVFDRTQMEPGVYPEYYTELADGSFSGKSIKFPINLTVDGTILNIWAGKIIKVQNLINGEKADIKIFRNGTNWTYNITFTQSIGRNITKWEGGEASLSTIPTTLEEYCTDTKTQLQHLGIIYLHSVIDASGITQNPLVGAVFLWLKDGKYYLTSEYSPCGQPTPSTSQIVMSLE